MNVSGRLLPLSGQNLNGVGSRAREIGALEGIADRRKEEIHRECARGDPGGKREAPAGRRRLEKHV